MPVILKENRIQNYPGSILAASLQDLAAMEAEGWTLDGTPTIVASPFGRAIRLDGITERIIIDDEYSLRFNPGTQDFSIVAMIRLDEVGATYVITDKRDANDVGWRLLVSVGQAFGSVNAIDVGSLVGAVVVNTWTLIGFSVDRTGNGQIYINGNTSGAAVAIGGAVMVATSDLSIGRTSYANSNRLRGDIDSVTIYNTLLSAADQLQLYKNYAGLGTNP